MENEPRCVHHCHEMFNCCDCGTANPDDGCGCRYCFSCNACDYCLHEYEES